MTEVRALLLTDVVESTQLSETLGDTGMAVLWAKHDRVARDLLPVWRGREIDKSDGMLLLFDALTDAAAYALAYHRALANLNPPLRARAGLHIGPVILRENSALDVARGAKPLEVEGTAKAVVARVMSIANGGQTLLSADAQNALGDTSLRLESHGHWRMKGIAEPIELFEIGDIDTLFVPPPDAAKGYRVVCQADLWLPARSVRHSLPAERDAFVGRRETLVALARRFDAGARLVSVLGIGGTGKTRVVTRFGWSWLGDFPGGVWFCDLSEARGLDGIVHAVAQGLDVPLGQDEPVTQLGHAIAGRAKCLMIIDNFEQVAHHAQDTLGRWLNRAAEARFIVTTREVLGLPGEEVLALAPLAPSEATALFLCRAEAAQPGFKPSDEDRSAIAPLVQLLEGLPLAIELAAARVRLMPPRTLLSRMNERFKLLASSRGRVDRQATLRAVFDWSWDLLSMPEKAALAQLSVFEGGFTLESVESVLDLSEYENPPWPMDALQSLVQKSLVRHVTDDRFDLLVSVQEYAAEHLRTAARYPGSGPAALRQAQVRHGAYFAWLDEKAAVADGCAELGNLVVACRRAAARGDAEVAANALRGAWAGLALRGPYRVGVELASMARGTPGLESVALALVAWVAGRAWASCGNDLEARVHFEASLDCARSIRDRRGECRALLGLGERDTLAGRVEAARLHLGAALVVARELNDRKFESETHNLLGCLDYFSGQMREARPHLETALDLAREVGDRDLECTALGNLGNLYCMQESLDKGRQYVEAVLAVAREINNRRVEGNALCNLGKICQLQGRFHEALGHLVSALAVARDLGNGYLQCSAHCVLGEVYDRLSRYDEARHHFELAISVARELGDRRSEGQFLGYLGLLHGRQAKFDKARRCMDEGEVLLRAISDRLSLGILLCSRAEAENLAGVSDVARAAFEEAALIAAELGAGPDSELGRALAHVLTLRDQGGT